jgi:tRNA pseudouridine38-40 synthase
VPRNIKLTLAYDGAPFFGWQVQPERPTVQGELAAAIARITGETVVPQGSGRTDAGVHALAQVATFSTSSPIPAAGLVTALNDTLPPAIRALTAEDVPPEFHARLSATAKTYRYRIYRGAICPPFLARYVYHHPYPLDEARMNAAAAEVVGTHDFTSFAASDPEKRRDMPSQAVDGARSGVRTIFGSAFRRDGDELVYEVRGSGFLHHMVRNLVGTFLLVGKGTLAPAEVRGILGARDRSANPGATAPASGLYLVSVEY